MIGRTNTGGGGSGGTLTVTGVAGDAVTVSKDSKTYSRTFNSSGIATVKGLKTGTWTVTMTNGTKTATKTVTINADYTLTMAYFSATIKVTYPSGSTCTATCGSTTLTEPSTTGSWTCTVPNSGTWTIKCTNGSQSTSSTVKITTDGEVKTVELVYTLHLFKAGSGVTSGYTINKTASKTFSITDDKIVWSTDTNVGNQVWITPAINLSRYNKVCFDFKCTGRYSSSYSVTIGVGSDVPTSSGMSPGAFVASTGVSYSTTRGTYSVDLSAITAETKYYIKFGARAVTGEIYNIWLT